jgi:PAS domain S-box-containing protein
MQTINHTSLENLNVSRQDFRRSMIALTMVYPFVHYTLQKVDSLAHLPSLALYFFPTLFLLGLLAERKFQPNHRQLNILRISLFFIQLFYIIYLIYEYDFSESVTFTFFVYILMTANALDEKNYLAIYLSTNLIITLIILLITNAELDTPKYIWAFWYIAIFVFIYLMVVSKMNRQEKLTNLQNQLLEQKSETDELMDALSAMIYYKDTNNKILRINKAMANFLGKEPAFFIGMSLYDLIPRGRAHTYHEEDLKIIRTGQTINNVIEEVVTPLGERRWVRSDKKPYRDKNGDIKGVVIYSLDITEEREVERQLRQKEALFSKIFDEAPYSVMVMDLGKKILHGNTILCHQLAYSEAELTRLSLQEIVHPSDISILNQLYEDLTPEQQYSNHEIRLKKQSNEYINTNFVVTEIRDENDIPVFYLGMLENITEKRQAEAQLEVYSKSLEESNKDLEQFAYIISHDLKEPLRMITSYTQLLKRRYSSSFDDSAHEFMEYVVDGAKRMNDLINDLLLYSRAGRDTDNKQSVEIDEIIYMVLNNLRMQIQETKADIIINPELPVVYCNKPQITALFQNLISNAIKYKKENVVPKIELKVEQKNNFWQFAIQDNGIGMKEEHLEIIFLIFQRLHNRNEYSGSGIGLAIAKRIVNSNGGEIWVESKIGEGSTFYFTLPIIAQEEQS